MVGGKNKINGFGRPMYSMDTCTADEFIHVLEGELGYIEKASNKDLDNKTANPGMKIIRSMGSGMDTIRRIGASSLYPGAPMRLVASIWIK